MIPILSLRGKRKVTALEGEIEASPDCSADSVSIPDRSYISADIVLDQDCTASTIVIHRGITIEGEVVINPVATSHLYHPGDSDQNLSGDIVLNPSTFCVLTNGGAPGEMIGFIEVFPSSSARIVLPPPAKILSGDIVLNPFSSAQVTRGEAGKGLSVEEQKINLIPFERKVELFQDGNNRRIVFEQSIGESMRYAVNWSEILEDDKIQDSAWVSYPNSGVLITDELKTKKETSFLISGGQPGHLYMLTNSIITESGDVHEVTIALYIKTRYLH